MAGRAAALRPGRRWNKPVIQNLWTSALPDVTLSKSLVVSSASGLDSSILLSKLARFVWRILPQNPCPWRPPGPTARTHGTTSGMCDPIAPTLPSAASMGSTGDCYDNALCERCLATLECERLDRRNYRTQAEARMSVFQYIEGWYNPHRRHSALGYFSPMDFEKTSSVVDHATD